MKKKVILAGVVLAAFLMLVTPIISAINTQAVEEAVKEIGTLDTNPLLLLLAGLASVILAFLATLLGNLLTKAVNALLFAAGLIGLAYVVYSVIEDLADMFGVSPKQLGIFVTKEQIREARDIALGRNIIGEGPPIPDYGFDYHLTSGQIKAIIYQVNGWD
jgi:hypothetical protein